MFTLDQVNEIHDTHGTSGSLLHYAKALKDVGVLSFDTYVIDGHTEFFGDHDHVVKTPAQHNDLIPTEVFDEARFKRTMKWAEKGKIAYLDMSKELAKAGVEKWTMDTHAKTFTYFDTNEKPVLVEQLG